MLSSWFMQGGLHSKISLLDLIPVQGSIWASLDANSNGKSIEGVWLDCMCNYSKNETIHRKNKIFLLQKRVLSDKTMWCSYPASFLGYYRWWFHFESNYPHHHYLVSYYSMVVQHLLFNNCRNYHLRTLAECLQKMFVLLLPVLCHYLQPNFI